jgi:hypothetical protein
MEPPPLRSGIFDRPGQPLERRRFVSQQFEISVPDH